jgi:hypothetical protein
MTMIAPSYAWKLVLAIVLVAAIFASAYAKAPNRTFPGNDLRRMVVGALALYGAGMFASLSHREVIAPILYAAGITVLALAAWLSRGSDSGGGPPRGDEPVDEHPPPDPDSLPTIDWPAFEREFGAYASRRDRTPVA